LVDGSIGGIILGSLLSWDVDIQFSLQFGPVTRKALTSTTFLRYKSTDNKKTMGKTKYFLRTLPFCPWVVSATWLHVGAPQKI
jgi:hypothetical protein